MSRLLGWGVITLHLPNQPIQRRGFDGGDGWESGKRASYEPLAYSGLKMKKQDTKARPRGRATLPVPSIGHGAPAAYEQPSATPAILDAVRGQNGTRWIRYGGKEEAIWMLISDLAGRGNSPPGLIHLDPKLLQPANYKALVDQVANHSIYREALTASSPGWHEQSFVLGDGRVLVPSKGTKEVIVTFAPQNKFEPCGTLGGWQNVFKPLVVKQPLPLFALALAFVGPLMWFAPPDYLSPFFELVGDQGTGKTTLGIAAISVWAGRLDGTSGGGETWNFTPGRLDELKSGHRHSLLLLDEGNLAGAEKKDREKLTQQAIFNLTSTGERQRFGGAPEKPHSQLAILSTSNRRLCDLVGGLQAERGAMAERLISIHLGESRSFGVFDRVPTGFKSSAQAAEALVAAANAQWGTAGPEFVVQLQKRATRDEVSFRKSLAILLARQVLLLKEMTDAPRIQKSFALVAVAGQLARRWGILPDGWGSPARAVRAVAAEALSGLDPVKEAAAAVQSYSDRHRSSLLKVADLKQPLDRLSFDAAAGFLREIEGKTELLVPARQFQKTFPNYRQIVRNLRNNGSARTEMGKQSKLTIKSPKPVCDTGRVYCFRLS